MKIRNQKSAEKNQLSMTSMIDIVFLLLIFFVMTFKIVELEGDFSVRMPLAGTSNNTIDDTELPIKLRMRSNGDGQLVSMSLNEIDLGTDFDSLRGRVVDLIGAPTPGLDSKPPELKIDADYGLRYKWVIDAITAVSGYKDGDQVVKLIENISFDKPRRG
ncbi:MAG: biopolymer transporter ExbD [Planctomycetota bacterium]